MLAKVERILWSDPGKRGIGRVAEELGVGHLERAATMLAAASRVAIVTGFYIPAASAPETDGPLGAAALARAVRALGNDAVVVTDRWNVAVVREAVRVVCPDVPVTEAIPDDADLLIAIERLGRARDGTYRNMRGDDVSSTTAALDTHFIAGNVRSIGIGDGGNEIGMGLASQIVAKYVPRADVISTIVKTDVLLCTGVSNWAGHVLGAAAVHIVNGDVSSARVPRSMERDALAAIEAAGAVDGPLRKPNMSIDGVPFEEYFNLIDQCVNELTT